MISLGTFNERSAGVFDCAFTDENGSAVIPKSVKWTITDSSGNVINSREQVPVNTPQATTTITIYGDDLKILEFEPGEYASRFIVIEGTYDSGLGTGLTTTEDGYFKVKNLRYIS